MGDFSTEEAVEDFGVGIKRLTAGISYHFEYYTVKMMMMILITCN